MKKAISVLSGGLDCTVATSVYSKDYEIHAITFNYGQKSFKRELQASKEICEKMGFKHYVIDLPWLAQISTSSLNTDEDIPEIKEVFGFQPETWFLLQLQHLLQKVLERK